MAAPFARKKSKVHDRVWKLDELNIFDELQKPVSVVISSVYENSRRYSSNLPWHTLDAP